MNPADFFSDTALDLANAVKADSPNEIRRLTALGVDPNIIGSRNGVPGPSLLAFALQEQKKNSVSALLRAGANPNQPLAALNGASAMIFAPRHSDLEYTSIMLTYGGNPNAKNAGGQSLLQIAALNENWSVVRLLLEKGADINSAELDGETLILQITGRGDFEHALFFLEHGADALQRMSSGASAARDIFHTIIDGKRFPVEIDWQNKCRQYLKMKGIKDPGPNDEFNPRPVPDWPKR